MVGHSNLGLGRRRPAPSGGGQPLVLRDPSRRRGIVRGVGVRKTDRAPGGVSEHRGARRDQPAHRFVGRQRGPSPRDRVDRPGGHAGSRTRRVPRGRPDGCIRQGGAVGPGGASGQQARRARQPGVQVLAPQPGRLASDLSRRGPEHRTAGRPGRVTDGPHHPPEHRAARRGSRRGRRETARGEATGHHRRPRRSIPNGCRRRARRTAAVPGDHDLQRQGASSRITTRTGAECWGEAAPPSPAGS